MALIRRIAFALMLAGVAVTTSARAEWIMVEGALAYDSESARYDPGKDVLGVHIDDFMLGSIWLAFRCGSATVWNVAMGQWEALDSNFHPLRDALCAQRETLPVRDFLP